MRPTRTARTALLAFALALVSTILGAPLSAAADPVPEACPHLTVERGEIDFVALVDDAPGTLRGVAWDCGFVIPDSAQDRWQYDLSGGRYEDFFEIVDALFAEGWTFTGGGYDSLTGSSSGETLEDDLEAWPRGISSGLGSAYAGFRQRTSGGEYFSVFLSWQESEANGASLTSSTWGWGGGGEVEESPYQVTRRPAAASWFMLDLWKLSSGSSSLPQGTAFDSPSTVSQLKSAFSAAPSAAETIVLVVSGVLLTLLVGFPGYLLTAVLSARWDRWFGWTRRPADAIRRVTSRHQAPWVFWVGIAVASLIAAFIDPRFGFNWMSLRLYLTLFAAFAVFNVGAWLVIGRVLRRIDPEARPGLQFRLGSLVVLVFAVLISRLLSFEPGIVFGLVAGLVFATTLIASRRATVVLVGTGFAAAAGVSAWIIYSILSLTIGSIDNGFAVGVVEFFGGLTIQGVATLPLALLPLAALDGAHLFGWNRVYWAVTYLLASVLFVLVMLNVPGGLTAVPGDFLRWLGLYVAFAVVATAVWGIDLLVERRREAPRLPESEGAR